MTFHSLAFETLGSLRRRSPRPDAAWTAVFALVRRKVFVWYLMPALMGSVAVGFLYQFALSW